MLAIVLKDAATGKVVAPVKDPRKDARAERSACDMNLLISVLKQAGMLTADVVAVAEVPANVR